ncbi:MAG: acyl-CoA thioesterase [Parafannyhessea umbonata]|nr:acyl-CoA thioesterase [Parafannyhessea umbonata]
MPTEKDSMTESDLNQLVSQTAAPQDTRPLRSQERSRTRATHTVVHGDMNGENRLFGGRLMEWIDEAAGIAARRHCGGSVTTACVDSLVFKNPAYLNEIVVIDAYVTYVGKTSLEVRVDSYVEDVATGERKQINVAYLTEVCVGEDERPRRIPFGLKLDTDEQRNEWHMAQIRKMIRRERQEQGI